MKLISVLLTFLIVQFALCSEKVHENSTSVENDKQQVLPVDTIVTITASVASIKRQNPGQTPHTILQFLDSDSSEGTNEESDEPKNSGDSEGDNSEKFETSGSVEDNGESASYESSSSAENREKRDTLGTKLLKSLKKKLGKEGKNNGKTDKKNGGKGKTDGRIIGGKPALPYKMFNHRF